MKKILFFILLFSKTLFASECPPLQSISKELTGEYDVIFYGKVDSVFSAKVKGKSIAYFSIQELYKGSVSQQVKVNFDESSDCMMSFAKNDEWLMYCTFQRFDELTVNICSHSRKSFIDPSDDFYQLEALRTFDEEREFLKLILKTKPFSQKNELNQQQTEFRPHNDQPSGINKLLLLLVSFCAMLIVYFVTRKKDKNDK